MSPRLKLSIVSAAFFALAATGLIIEADPAVAQGAKEEMEEIVLEAPFIRRAERVAIGASKAEVIELRRRVSYADLDLRKSADVTELKTRIEKTATESCEKLSEMFRLDRMDKDEIQRCIDMAVDGTEDELQAAIAAAS